MKTIFLPLPFFAVILSVIISCSHSPYGDFEKIKIGDDKEAVLTRVGSPVRSHFQAGKDIWTYRFYVDGEMVYKDVVLDNHKVVEIKESQELEIKEKKVEADLKEIKKSKNLEKNSGKKEKIDDAYIEKKLDPKDPKFTPVE